MYRFKQIYECIYEQLDMVVRTEINPEDDTMPEHM